VTLEINLLPRLTPYQKYRAPIFLGVILLIVTLVAAAFLYYLSLNSQIDSVQKELERIKGDNTVLKAERAISKDLRLYYDIKNEAQKLREHEQEYAKILDGLASKLSAKTEVYAASMNPERQRLELDIRAESLDVIADLAALLRTEPWVQDVYIERIRNNDKQQDEPTENEKTEATNEAFTSKIVIQIKSANDSKANSNTAKPTK